MIINTAEFIRRSIEEHGNNYDYSLSAYTGSKNKLEIICKTHGSFWQSAETHWNGSGCRKCSTQKNSLKLTRTTDSFKNKAREKHGDLYNYDNVVYIKNNLPVEIICSSHGSFLQKPDAHLCGKGCRKCSTSTLTSRQTKTLEEFIAEANDYHCNKYSYEMVNYQTANIKVSIICPAHGTFLQTPSAHLNHGCKKCAIEQSAINYNCGKESFIQKAKIEHGERYDYSKVIYKNSATDVEIICSTHGSFWQKPVKHLYRGFNCPKCKGPISNQETIWLAHLNIPDDKDHRQVKIFCGENKYRVDGFLDNTVYEYLGDYWHGNMAKYNSNYLHPVIKKSMRELNKNTMERLNNFKQYGYRVIYIWESDFKNNELKGTIL